ncbi:MAG: hypothetical protein WBN75_05590 [Verrucomicrobiia bacterium]|jgi:hypothetical protein
MKTKDDDGLEWLREIRARLAKKFDYDPRKAGAYYRRRQAERGARIYRPEVPAGAGHTVDALHDQAHAEIAAGQCATLTSYRAARKRKAKRAK